jgi:hypothetical protein
MHYFTLGENGVRCFFCVDWLRTPTSLVCRQRDRIATRKIHRCLGQTSTDDTCGVIHADGYSSQYMPYKGAA